MLKANNLEIPKNTTSTQRKETINHEKNVSNLDYARHRNRHNTMKGNNDLKLLNL